MRRVFPSHFLGEALCKTEIPLQKARGFMRGAALLGALFVHNSAVLANEYSSDIYEVLLKYNKPLVKFQSRAQPKPKRLAAHFQTSFIRHPAPASQRRTIRYSTEETRSVPAHTYSQERLANLNPRKKQIDPAEDHSDVDRIINRGAGHSLPHKTSYCVRTCDGAFFPVGRMANAGWRSHEANWKMHEESCYRLCPDAETTLFVAPAGGRGIKDARSRTGVGYNDLPASYDYKKFKDLTCTCHMPAKSSKNNSVLSDKTLRKGDIVMAEDGLRALRSEDTKNISPEHFAPVDVLNDRENVISTAVQAFQEKLLYPLQFGKAMQEIVSTQLTIFENKLGVYTRVEQASGEQRTRLGTRYVGPDRF